jgi:hypothetical protein
MQTIKCRVFWITGQTQTGDLCADLMSGDRQDSVLTTDHPASSYGLPVVLDGEGGALGPADMDGCTLYCAEALPEFSEAEVPADVRAAGLAAGYRMAV